MKTPPKKKNPQDATRRNVQATNKRLTKIENQLRLMRRQLTQVLKRQKEEDELADA